MNGVGGWGHDAGQVLCEYVPYEAPLQCFSEEWELGAAVRGLGAWYWGLD